MKNKGAIIALTVIVTLLCLFYLSFTLVSRNVQNKANDYATDAEGRIDYFKKQEYLDSLWNEPVYNFLGILEFTYKEVKENELNLGLDLQGGMHVTLEISPVEILKALSGNNQDEQFQEALELARQRQLNSQENFTSLFFSAFEEVAPNKSLASVFANSANRGRIDFNTPDDEVQQVIEGEVEGAIDRAFNVIRTRIDKFGVSQPSIQRVPGTGRIQIELPGVDNPKRIRKLLQGVAKLEFLEVWTPQEFAPYLGTVNDYLVKKKKAERQNISMDSLEQLEAAPAREDELLSDTDELMADDNTDALIDETLNDTAAQDDALFDDEGLDSAAMADSLMNQMMEEQVSDIYRLLRSRDALVYDVQDTGKINDIIYDPAVQALIPPDLQFMWEVKPQEGPEGEVSNFIQLYPVRKSRLSGAQLTGEVIVDARQSFDQNGQPDITMQMNVEGAKKWRKMTGNNIGRQIAIVLDNYVYSAPVVQGEIPSGNSSITGNFSIEEAQDLANVLKAGKLPAPTRIVEEVVVGPSLGLEAQQQGVISVVIGLVIVILFMVGYYARGGIVADIALAFNIFFIFGILAQFGAALTLPGIAGIVLTIGMSIDANVLIFERIREELRKDSNNLLNAIRQGYERAFWTIFDANVTTFLTGIFLYVFGSGPVKGFAVTLMIGIACSFFSAVYITRVIVTWMTKKGNKSKINFETGLSRGLLDNVRIKFISKRKTAYIVSSIVLVIGIVTMFVNGLNLGVDFQGGRSYIVEFTKAMTPTELEVGLKNELENASVEVKTFGNSEKLKVTTNYMVENESTEADSLVMAELVKGLEQTTGLTYQPADELLGEGNFIIPSSSKVGATIADDITEASEEAVLFSLIAIFLYIWVRFRNWRFGLGAVAALFHDSLIVISIYTIANILGFAFEIDQVFVAATLTIIGYSINDTVVVFDRIREYLGIHTSQSLEDTLDDSINSTLNRTLITSLTTLLVVMILLFFGGEVLRGFSFALFVGILVGTYSSIFMATPIYYDTQKAIEKQQSNKAKKAAKAGA